MKTFKGSFIFKISLCALMVQLHLTHSALMLQTTDLTQSTVNLFISIYSQGSDLLDLKLALV